MHAELLIDGTFVGGPCDQAVGKQVLRSPFNGRFIGTAAEGGETELRACLDAAHSAFQTWRHSPRHVRQAMLRNVARLVRARASELADILVAEIGKPITAARGEVARLAITFDDAADLLATYGLEAVPVNLDPRGMSYRCSVERFPLGVIFCIVPYNWPYNLSAHKVAPAIATGNTVIVKPSPLAPISTLTLLRLIHEAGCPPGVVNGWSGDARWVEKALEDRRVRMLSFTGSADVGWKLKGLMPDRRVTLELGGDASAIVCADADLDWALPRITSGAYIYAGQVCISIQHLLVHRSVYAESRSKLIELTANCAAGDPALEWTACGPMISLAATDRALAWMDEAKAKGAAFLAGGGRKGNVVEPTLMEGVPLDSPLACEEAFAPILTLAPFDSLDEAFASVNRSKYGIHCGVFTNDIRTAERAFQELEVGGVIVNDYPTLRFDNMPYGGVKQSGFGREGVRYAMDEMTELKTLLVKVV